MIPDGRVYCLYPNSKGSEGNYSHGSYGSVLDLDDLQRGANDVGDVNGDGFDDVALCDNLAPKVHYPDLWPCRFSAVMQSSSRRMLF
jgi:hypothetical protein